MKRLKEIWKETVKKHLRKWRQLPDLAFKSTEPAWISEKVYFKKILETVTEQI
tara:strand:- start:370 stop:528 length:159 start_codon:yes stop_codon:yes gene_type:complete